jgi:hypothetical protein
VGPGALLRRWRPTRRPSSAKVARTSRDLEKKRHDLLEEAGTDGGDPPELGLVYQAFPAVAELSAVG